MTPFAWDALRALQKSVASLDPGDRQDVATDLAQAIYFEMTAIVPAIQQVYDELFDSKTTDDNGDMLHHGGLGFPPADLF